MNNCCENCARSHSLYYENVGCCEMFDTLGECEFEPIAVFDKYIPNDFDILPSMFSDDENVPF